MWFQNACYWYPDAGPLFWRSAKGSRCTNRLWYRVAANDRPTPSYQYGLKHARTDVRMFSRSLRINIRNWTSSFAIKWQRDKKNSNPKKTLTLTIILSHCVIGLWLGLGLSANGTQMATTTQCWPSHSSVQLKANSSFMKRTRRRWPTQSRMPTHVAKITTRSNTFSLSAY